ncbi:UDP pyrophosphate phosphatase [Mycoplasmatota bacterium]|nr:UDP pyrophosphate phosphatase [Mycoplasmatota bacterium]
MAIIEALKYLILGIVQGVTEVLPISSSGHVEITKHILSVDFVDSIIFLIIVNTGSLFTFLLIYYKKILRIVVDFFVYIFNKDKRESSKKNFIYALKIVLATIPAGLIGLILNDQIEDMMLNHALLIVSIGLLLTSTVLFLVTREEPFNSKRNHLSWLDVGLMGLAQSVALIPGVSRSGMTSSTALKRGASINATLDFSFIMYIPVSFGSLILLVVKVLNGESTSFDLGHTHYYLLAFFGALIATYIAYKLIFNIFRSGKLKYFSYYCLGASLFALVLYVL